MTRAQNRAAFAHVLNTILDQDAQDPLKLALADADVSTITSLITLPKSSIDALMFERPLVGSDPPTIERVALQIGNKNLIHWFTRWSYALFHSNTRFPLTHDEWLETKVDDFNHGADRSYDDINSWSSCCTRYGVCGNIVQERD